MLNNLIETLGYAVLIAFLYACWPPLALLGAGLYLVVGANVRAARSAGRPGRTAAAVTAAFAAGRRAYAAFAAPPAEQATAELRRVA